MMEAQMCGFGNQRLERMKEQIRTGKWIRREGASERASSWSNISRMEKDSQERGLRPLISEVQAGGVGQKHRILACD